MSDLTVGTAFLQISASFDGFEDAIDIQAEEAGKSAQEAFSAGFNSGEGPKLTVGADTAAASAELDAFGVKADEIGAKRETVEVSTNYDDFSYAPIDDLYAAMTKAGIGSDNFTDKMQRAGISEEDLASFTEKAGVSLDDLVTHMDSAGRTSSTLGSYFEGLKFSADDLGKSFLSSGSVNVDVLENHLKDLGTETEELVPQLGALGDSAGGSGGASDGLDRMSSSSDDASRGLSGIAAAAVTVGPALIPVAIAATGALIALGGAVTAAGVGVAAFALAAAPEMGSLKDETGALLTSFQSLAAPSVMPVLAGSVGLVKSALQAAIPLVGSTSSALLVLEHDADSALQSPSWHGFTTFLAAEAGPAITSFGTVVLNLGHGFGNLLVAFAPVETQMESGLVRLSQGFENWTSSTGGVQGFLSWFETEGPVVVTLLKNVSEFAGLAVQAFAGWGTILITVANPLLEILNDLLRVNPLLGEVAAGLIVGAVAWSKWGDGVRTAITGVEKIPEILSAAATGFDAVVVRLSTMGTGFGAATVASDGLTEAEGAGVVAADADAAAQARLGEASGAAAIPMTDLRVASAGAAIPMTDLRTAAEGAGAGLLTGGTAAAGFGDALLAASAVALPFGAVVAGIALGWDTAAQQADHANTSTAKLTQSMEGQGATTIPQLNQAIGDNKNLLNDLANENLKVTDTYIKQYDATGQVDQATTNLQSTFNDGYTPAVQKIQAENAKLNTDLLNQEQNLGVLNVAFAQTGVSASLTSTQANLLADSIGINLNKALTGSQVQQFIADLKQMSQETGITASALENLAQMSGESLTTLTKGLDQATQATSKSFGSASSLLAAFGGQTAVTGQQIQLFYGQAESEATTFTANIRTAITDGYDPQLISQLLQAGPAQAGPLLQALVDGASQGMVQTVAGATSALAALNTEAIQEQKITYEAITAGTSKAGQQMASDVSNALAVQQQISVQGASATVASVNAVLNIGVGNVQRISDEYGLALPTALQQHQQDAYLQALAQSQQGPKAMASEQAAMAAAAANQAGQIPAAMLATLVQTANAADQQARALPTAVNQQTAAAADAAVAQAGGVTNAQVSELAKTAASSLAQAQALPTAVNQQTATSAINALAQAQTVPDSQIAKLAETAASADQQAQQLPTAVNEQTANAANAALQQALTVSSSQNAALPGTQAAAGAHASALPDSIFARITDTFNNALSQATGVGGGMNAAQGQVFGAASALSSGAWNRLQIGDTSGIGEAAASGIAAGLNAGAGAVESAAQSIANNVSNTIKAALKVSSPSKVTTEIGQFVAQGLAVGMESSIPLVAASAGALASAAISNMASPMGISPSLSPSLTASNLGASMLNLSGLGSSMSTITNAQRSISIGDVHIIGADLGDPAATKVAVMEGLVEALSGSKN